MTEERDVYVQKLKAKMEECNAEIDRLEAAVAQAGAKAKVEYHNKQLEDLRARYKGLEVKLGAAQQAGEGAWEDLKQGLENSWEILKTSFTRAKFEFKRGYKEGLEE